MKIYRITATAGSLSGGGNNSPELWIYTGNSEDEVRRKFDSFMENKVYGRTILKIEEVEA